MLARHAGRYYRRSPRRSHTGSAPPARLRRQVHIESTQRERVVLGMSGGVDSSIAALLLKREGKDVVGVYMKNWEALDEEAGRCQEEEDWKHVEGVAKKIDIPAHRADFVKQRGCTPNPDVLCNREIKFKAFLEYARQRFGAEKIATGHYARIGAPLRPGAPYRLLRAADADKDQTYFLSSLTHDVLPHVLFPIGSLAKPQIRRMAAEAGFANADRRSSVGICFIGKRKFASFMEQYITPAPGPIRCIDTGEEVGRHRGIAFYTVGQGARISGAQLPWVVCGKDAARRELYVCHEKEGQQHPALYSNRFRVSDFNWISGVPPDDLAATSDLSAPYPFQFRMRHRQALAGCRTWVASRLATDEASSRGPVYEVASSVHLRGTTPGQVFVLYHGEQCLGGGPILDVEGQTLRLLHAENAGRRTEGKTATG